MVGPPSADASLSTRARPFRSKRPKITGPSGPEAGSPREAARIGPKPSPPGDELANPGFRMEFEGLPWDFERNGTSAAPKPVRLFTT